MLESLFTSALLQATGMAILHSLWQATLLAGLLWVVSRYTSLKAKGRYRLAFATLLLQAAASGFTFGYYYEPSVAEGTVVHAGGGGARDAVIFLAQTPTSLWNTAEFWLVLLVVCWAAGLIIGGGRLVIAYAGILRLKRSARSCEADGAFSAWHRHVTALADRMGYRGTLRLGLTDRITGPMLVGHLKPVLLFPVAMVNQLTTEEAETVILHELAHLRRADHLFHLLQCLIEVFFYYHPAVHWIGARIREEREHCCDDLVLRYGPGRLPYARALLYFSEQSAKPVAAALSLTDGGGLLARVRRFIDHQEIKYTMKSRLFLLPLLAVVTLVGTAAYAPAEEHPEAPLPVEIPPAPALAAPDTLPPGDHQVTKISNGETTRLRVQDGQIKELELEGKVIPEEEYPEYEDTAEELLGLRTPRNWMEMDTIFNVDPITYEIDTAIFGRIARREEFSYEPHELHLIAQRALESVNMDSIMDVVRIAQLSFMDADSLQRIAFNALQDVDMFQFDEMKLDSSMVFLRGQGDFDRLMNTQQLQELHLDAQEELKQINRQQRHLQEALRELEQRKSELEQGGQ